MVIGCPVVRGDLSAFEAVQKLSVSAVVSLYRKFCYAVMLCVYPGSLYHHSLMQPELGDRIYRELNKELKFVDGKPGAGEGGGKKECVSWESNPALNLGRVQCYRYTTDANR